MLISVVIPAHNAAGLIPPQLEALVAQADAGEFEVLVVDNASIDDTRLQAESFSDRLDLRVIDALDGRSASYARNVGAKHARGDVIVFVDADDVAHNRLLATYAREASRYRIMGGAYEERLLNAPEVAAWRYELTARGLPVAFGKIPFFLMGNAAIHRSVFDELGGFDEALTHGGEEVDFSVRAKLAGIEIGWVPDAIVHYRHRTTLRGLAEQFFDYGRATRYVYAKYRRSADLPTTRLRDCARAMWAVLPRVVNVARGSRRRGDWVRVTSFYAGEVVETLAQWRRRR